MSVNEIIKKLRTERKMTQNELAEKLNCNRQKIADWERGKACPSANDLIILSDIFSVSTDYLLGISTVQTKDKDLQFVCDYTKLSEESIKILHSKWGMSCCDIIDFLLGADSYHEFWDLCNKIRQYRTKYRDLIDFREKVISDNSIKPNSVQQLETIINTCDTLLDNRDLAEFKLQKQLTEMIKSYCSVEVERDKKINADFQKTYNYLLNGFLEEFLLRSESENNVNNP